MSFKQEFDHCKDCDCGSKRLIVNRTRWLCEEKNRERLLENEEKSLSKKQSSVKKPSGVLRNFSSKREKIEIEYRKVQREILEERQSCNNCGTTENLSFSHLIPRSRRVDLISNKKNIVLHCLYNPNDSKGEGCHDRWERKDISMKDYRDNIEKVKELDIEYYHLINI